MKTVTILESFDGYPQGAKPGSRQESYRAGEEREVSNEFGDLIIGKGLAREDGAKAKASKATPAEADSAKDATQ